MVMNPMVESVTIPFKKSNNTSVEGFEVFEFLIWISNLS